MVVVEIHVGVAEHRCAAAVGADLLAEVQRGEAAAAIGGGEIGGTGTSLGVEDNAVALPTADESWRFETFTVEEYEEMYQQVLDGTLVVDDDYTKLDTTDWSNLNLTVI